MQPGVFLVASFWLKQFLLASRIAKNLMSGAQPKEQGRSGLRTPPKSSGPRTPPTSGSPAPGASRQRGAQDASGPEASAAATGAWSRPLGGPEDSFNSQGKGGFIQAELGVATGRELDTVNEGLRRLRVMEQNNDMLRQRIRDSNARYHEQEEQLALREVTIQWQNTVIQQLGAALAAMSSGEGQAGEQIAGFAVGARPGPPAERVGFWNPADVQWQDRCRGFGLASPAAAAASGSAGPTDGTGFGGRARPAIAAPPDAPARAVATGSGEMSLQQVTGALDVDVERRLLRRLLAESEAVLPAPETKRQARDYSPEAKARRAVEWRRQADARRQQRNQS